MERVGGLKALSRSRWNRPHFHGRCALSPLPRVGVACERHLYVVRDVVRPRVIVPQPVDARQRAVDAHGTLERPGARAQNRIVMQRELIEVRAPPERLGDRDRAFVLKIVGREVQLLDPICPGAVLSLCQGAAKGRA